MSELRARASCRHIPRAHPRHSAELWWFWSLTAIVPATPGVTNSHAARLEEVKVRFRRA